MRGGGDPMIEIIYAQHALRGTEPDWGAMGASDIGFAAGMCKQVGEQVKNVIEFPFVVVDGLFIKLPIALVHGLVQLAEDPQGTVEGLVEKIKVLPAYIEQVPAEFKAYIDEISAIEDPYQQGEALGQLMGDALPAGAVVGGVMGKVGKWKVTKAGKKAAKASQRKVKKIITRAVQESGGSARLQKYGHFWQKASLDKAIERHAGPNATSWVTDTGKKIFENPTTGRQIVVDPAGYFRIFQPKKLGSKTGKYLDMIGNIPAPAKFLKKGGVGNTPLTGGDLNKATHFLPE